MTERKVRLMRLYDGELDPAASEHTERSLAWDAAGREYLQALKTIGDGVRSSVHRAPPDLNLAEAVMARIEVECARSMGGPAAAAADAAAVQSGVANARSSVGRGDLGRRRDNSSARASLGSTLGLAAAILLWMFSGQPGDSDPASDMGPKTAPALVGAQAGVAIEAVDFGTGGGSIFMVQGSQTATPVVWLSEPPGSEVGSEPL